MAAAVGRGFGHLWGVGGGAVGAEAVWACMGGRGRGGRFALKACKNCLCTAVSGGSRGRGVGVWAAVGAVRVWAAFLCAAVQWGGGCWGRRGFGHALEACIRTVYVQQ